MKSVSKVQSVLIPRDQFTRVEASKWVRDNSYKVTFNGKLADVTTDFYRYRQKNPKKAHKYRTKTLSNGVRLVLQIQ